MPECRRMPICRRMHAYNIEACRRMHAYNISIQADAYNIERWASGARWENRNVSLSTYFTTYLLLTSAQTRCRARGARGENRNVSAAGGLYYWDYWSRERGAA
jgi:hypothetical protein